MPYQIIDIDGVTQAPGSAVPARGVQVLGSDGTNSRVLRVESDGTIRTNPTGTTTQPVSDAGGSLTIDATSLPLPTGAATEATLATLSTASNQTNGTQKAIVRGGAKGSTTAADVTSSAEGADHQALDVQIYHSGTAKDPTQIRALTSSDVIDVSDRVARKVGQAFLRNPGDSANMGDATTPVRVDPTGTTTQPISAQSEHTTNATLGKAIAIAGQFDDASTTLATEDNIAPLRLTEQRALHTNLRSITGDELGTTTNPLHFTSVQAASTSFYSLQFVQANTPASINSSTAGPYNVGNTTLNIAVNGGAQAYAFPVRAALAGYSKSSLDPATANGGNRKIKFAVDGGAAKEVTIAANLTSGAAIAAALQTQIRANVPNGANVVVDWNTTNPGRYTVTSGTTGASSKVITTKGGDALASTLKLGVAFGGTEATGLAANSYRNDEVVTLLNSELSDIDSSLTATGLVNIITRAGGVAATLQVTAGGANTALGFTTSLVIGANGTGSNQLTVNGSSTNVRFSLTIPEGYQFTVAELRVFIRDDTTAVNKTFGGLPQLTNGVLFEYKTALAPTGTLLNATSNAELFAQSTQGAIYLDAYTDLSDITHAKIEFIEGITLRPSTSDGIFITVRDNLTGLLGFTVTARGWLAQV